MPGAHTGADRYLTKTSISGNVYQESTAAGSSADTTTIASYALAGLFATIQLVPGSTQTASATVPAAPSTAAGKGWRDASAENGTRQITWDAVNWTVRLRAKASAAQSVLTTVIVYRVSGGTSTEMGRGTNTSSLTTTTTTLSITVPVSAALVFAAGDLIQVEVYCTTLLLGIATPPTVATTVTYVILESEANSGAKTSPSTYTLQVVSSATAAVSPVGAAARAIAAARAFAPSTSLSTLLQRLVAPAPKVSTSTIAATVQKRVSPSAKVAAASVATALQRTIRLTAKATATRCGW